MPATFNDRPSPPLTHRFTVLYEDGSTFEQPHDDRPRVVRQDGTGSSFGDVEVDRVKAFFLESGNKLDDPDKHLYEVHLEDGHFAIDGVEFTIGPNDPDLPLGYKRRLIYFRRVSHDQTSDLKMNRIVGREMRRCYHIGYDVLDTHGAVIHKVTIAVGHEVFRD